MEKSLLADAFDHHVWATIKLIDVCLELDEKQLETAAPGTYGSILDTMRHLVGADSWYLFDMTADPARRIEEDRMDLRELRAAMQSDQTAWSRFLAEDPDPDAVVQEVDESDGFERERPPRHPARTGPASRDRPSESDLYRPHGARRGAAGYRCLGVRSPSGPHRRGPTHLLMDVVGARPEPSVCASPR